MLRWLAFRLWRKKYWVSRMFFYWWMIGLTRKQVLEAFWELYLIHWIWNYHLISILSPASTLLEELLSVNRKIVDLSTISMLLDKIAYIKCYLDNTKSNNKGTREGVLTVDIECIHRPLLWWKENLLRNPKEIVIFMT